MANASTEHGDDQQSTEGRRRDDAKSFLKLCQKHDVDGDNGANGEHLPRPKYDAAMPAFDATTLLLWPSKEDIEEINILAAIFGEVFERSPAYSRNANAILKALFPFLTIDCIGSVLATYRQFAASYYVLENGLEKIYERFDVADHRELRSNAIAKVGSLQFTIKFMSTVPVSDGGQLQRQSHDLVLISARGERRRRSTRAVNLPDLVRLVRDPGVDENLRFEIEWLAYHKSTQQLQHHGANANGGRPQSLRAAFPIDHKPNAGWLRAFCLGRVDTPDGVKPDSKSIQCIECLQSGCFTKIARNESRTQRIMTHLEKYHGDVHDEVKMLTEDIFLAYLDSL